MKLHIDNQHFEGLVPSNRIPFKIASNAKLFGILSDGIYKDKILAVIRELSCNAHDVHVQTKNPKPFRVIIPSRLEPTFAVEDEGTGIDPERIADIYWTYGVSSKTDSNEQIGALGLGSKSPFAYTKSSFVVKNRWHGKEYTYFCFINENGVPDGSEVSVNETDKPNGITVELASRDEDVYAFHQRIAAFFKYWDTKPEFLGDDIIVPSPVKAFEGTDWFYEERDTYNRNALAIMGNVPYPIDISSIPSPSAALRFIATNTFVIRFPLGDLAFQSSREELSYEKVTIEALERAAKKVFSELKTAIVANVVKDVKTPLELMRRFKGMHTMLEGKLRNTHVLQGKIMHFFEKQDKFQLPNGMTFTAEELSRSKVHLDVPGSSPLGVYVGNGISSTGRWSMKQARTVKLLQTTTKPDPKDPTKTVPVETGREVPWYRPSTKPLLTPNALATSTLLANGFVPIQTSLTVETNLYGLLEFDRDEKDVIRFIVNDLGPKGSQGFRGYAKKHGLSTNKTFFIDADPYAKVADFGVSELNALLKDTLLDGSSVTLLSQMPDFELPKVEPKDSTGLPRVKHARGTVEVRMLTFKPSSDSDNRTQSSIYILGREHKAPHLRMSSTYERIELAGPELLYVVSDKGSYAGADKQLLHHADNLMAWLYKAGAFKDYGPELKVVSRKQEDIDYLLKRGLKLKRLSDVATEFCKRPEVDAAFKTIALAEAVVKDDSFEEVAKPEVLKTLLFALAGKKTFFEEVFTRAEQLAASLITNKAMVTDYGIARSRHQMTIKNPDVKSSDKEELLKRYPLLEGINLTWSRKYAYGAELKKITEARARHAALYIIAADHQYNIELAKTIAASQKVAVAN